ncbi:MAG: hypothetical protein Q8O67_16500 [Deltaproteobacteria bacterium]|nr:hypothetical protein [Deltaproteobacteria bacterium]
MRFVVVAVVALFVLDACAPFAARGEDCTEDPCAPGLVCTDGLCGDPPPPPPGPCVDDLQCELNSDASGRVCVDGQCEFADCQFDVQCGTRICVDGKCADGQLCLNDNGCQSDEGPDQLCIGNVCRDPCFGDDDCGLGGIGGIGLQTCVAGRCEQRCLGDFTCLTGGICEDGACIDPDCAENEDCNDDAQFCDAGRCTPFTTCSEDDDCFDANLFCDVDVEPIRCAERPACRADSECGQAALCLDRHCRPAESCFVNDDCGDPDDECIGARCVGRPACRADGDCGDGRICNDLRCEDAPAAVTAAFVVVADRLGSCATTCTRAVFVGEQLAFQAQGFDAAGAAVAGAVRANPTGAVTIVSSVDNLTRVSADAAGAAALEFGNVIVSLIVLDTTAPLSVVVTEEDGTPVAAADVEADGAAATTDAAGLAIFDPRPAAGVVVARFGGRATIVPLGATGAALRMVLPPVPTPDVAAALRVTVTSTGDEIGPVGIGFALPALDDAKDITLATVFGEVTQGEVALPVIGALPIAISSAMTLSAALPLVGEQVVRAQAQVAVAAGPAFITAWEDRREQQDLVALALAGDPTGTALDFAETSETMDAAIVAAGIIEATALVTDDADRDGDGDTTELIPDFDNAPEIEARPSGPPRERTSVVAAPPAGSNERAFVVVGFALPGRFLIAGTGVVRGATGFEDVPLPETLKAIPASPGLQTAPRVVVVSAVFDDPRLSSRARFVAPTFALEPIVDIGPLLPAPEGAFLLRDVPDDGDVSVIVPAVDAGLLRLTLRTLDDETVFFWVDNDGAARLPAGFLDVSLEEVRVYDADDVDAPFSIGSGPVDIERVARRVAVAPGG